MIIDEEDYLVHYGMPRRSGRYPWGSGDNVPEAPITRRNLDFLTTLQTLRKEGMSDPDICRAMGIGSYDRDGNFRPSTGQLRARNTLAKAELKNAQIITALALQEKGWSNGAIAERLGLAGESSVRALTAEGVQERVNATMSTADMLKRQVGDSNLIDVGAGSEFYITSAAGQTGVSAEKLRASVQILKEQGYEVHNVKVTQIATGKETSVKVLCPPNTTWGDAQRLANKGEIKPITEFSDDNGKTFARTHEPLSVNPNRVKVNFAEDGGDKADGVIYVRPGVDDVSIGKNSYAQVRIKVGDGHYLKGMAIYKDDLPAGVDLLFNTNKSKMDTSKMEAMKPLKNDADLPFGSIVRQIVADPGTPKERVTSAMNIVGTKEGSGVEGGWETWSKTLSSQMLSKQSPVFAKQQLDKTLDNSKKDLDEIMNLTNPTIKRNLLQKYAESTDAAAVHLAAAKMPRQATRVLLPINSMKDSEVYAPGFNDGERVALIRYPHGGTFEIPELTVNNKSREARALLGDAKDAVGINHKVAQRLSGADFDGDTVVVIPNNSRKVKATAALEGLKGFDPQMYKVPKGSPIPRMTAAEKGLEMGKVSNLITDMTILGAPNSEIVRAIRHSMVVIDAEKHHLDYKESAKRNGIPALKEKYQGGKRNGASTIISRANAEIRVPDRKERPQSQGGPIDKATGKKVYVETGKTYSGGKPALTKVKRLEIEDDANALVSEKRTRIELIYAEHSNAMKNQANQARKVAINTPPLKYSPSAKKAYASEVASLDSKLRLAKMNAPRERQAQLIANAEVKAKRQADPSLEGDALKKVKYQALTKARARVGANKDTIVFTPREWEAIQAGAITDSKLDSMLKNADMDQVRKLATPKPQRLMSTAKTQQAQTLLKSGATRAEVAKQLGVSLTTLDEATTQT